MTDRSDDLTPREERVRDAVRGLPDARPDVAFRERLRDAFVKGEIESTVPRAEAGGRDGDAVDETATDGGDNIVSMRRPIVPALLAAAAVFVLFFALWPREEAAFRVTRGDAVAQVESGGVAERLDGRARSVAPGARLAVAEGALELQWRDILAMRVNPGVVALPDPEEDEAMTCAIEKGEVIFLTGPGFAGRRLTVTTPEGRVEVVGTAFAVYRDETGTCVCVLEGEASVGVNDADMERVPPAKRKVIPSDGSKPQILDIMPPHRAGLVDFVERARGPVGG